MKIWSFSEKSNKDIYTQFVEPAIISALKNDQQSVFFWINLTYSLICSDLSEEKIANDLLKKIHSYNQSKYITNGTYLILKSYFKLK